MEKMKVIYTSVKRFCLRTKLGSLFLGVPAVLFLFGNLVGAHNPHVNPWHIMAYGMQMSAFAIFIRRVNLIYEFNHPDGKSIWLAIKSSIFPPETKMVSISGTVKASGNATAHLSKNEGTLTTEELSNRLRELEETVRKLPDEMDKKDREIKKALESQIQELQKEGAEDDREKANFNKNNAGPEFVAVLWLFLAALTFVVTHMVG